MFKKHRAGWVVSLLLVGVACSSSSSSPSGTGSNTGTGTGTGPGTTQGQGTVGSAGGQVSTSDGALTVTIPAGALPTDTPITITEIQSPAPGAIGKTYDIGPTGTQFATPVTLTFKYGGDDLMGNDPSSLEVATIVGSDWVGLMAGAVDTTAQSASGQTTHLSPYGIHAKSNGNGNGKDGGGTSNDATVSGDDGSTAADATQSADDAASDTGIDTGVDTGAQDAGFDATGCTYMASQVGSCANLPPLCQQPQTFQDCQPLGGAMGGVKGYCCP
jgi:hypothetical protein